jgi:putative oxidoreductase
MRNLHVFSRALRFCLRRRRRTIPEGKAMTNDILLLIARILLAFMFILSGVQKFVSIDGAAGYIAAMGLPASVPLAWLAAIFEVVAGLAVIVGFKTRNAAFLLAAFCIFTGLVFHLQPDDQMQMIMLMKNFTIAGGLFALAVSGPGRYSIDRRITWREQAA